MSNRNNDDGIIPLVIILVGGGIAYAVWQFSTLFGLDMSTGASVMGRLVGVAILAVLAWKFGGGSDLIGLGNIWPILLGLVWVSWWPALDYWATNSEPNFSLTDENMTVWFNAWYTELGVLIAFVSGGYLIKKLSRGY
ncbi:hypothetical protein [Burkholderia territorii]|uniref:hypothetical protein n=1 Tax=Burkholderia territorii TaxID=1503055 RepID=UPI00075DE57C|nr:hypothetical protein [Burkholderia territorii]KVQ69928.1 hypothetical protein WT23_05125 [Burkholderia territorii]